MTTMELRASDAIAMPQDAAQPKVHRKVHSRTCQLRAQGLKKAFGGQVVLDGVDLELRQGEVVLLRGENGSGKTTLLNILTGNLEPDAGTIHYLADGTPRVYHFPRRWWQDLNPFDHFTPEFVAHEGTGRTWQDVRLFGSQSLRDNIAVAEPDHPGENPILALVTSGRSALREGQVNRVADTMLFRLGLVGRESSSADKISLGQSKRVAIARAVAAGARILFLDEPLAGLDRQGISDALALLDSLVGERAVTLVIVEHVFNQPHLQGLVTTDWLLAGGRLKTSIPKSGIRKHQSDDTGQPTWFEILTTGDAEIRDEPLLRGALLTRIRRAGIFRTPPKPILEIRDLVVKRGARTVVGVDDHDQATGLNLTLYQGEIGILQAPNGWGKTTLFAAITGLINVSVGDILLEGHRLNGLPVWERVHKGLRALQADHNTFPNLKAREVLQLAGEPSPPAHLESLAARFCSSLSGGQKQRVALEAACTMPPNASVQVLDEPLSAFDSTASRQAIQRIAQPGRFASLLMCPYAHLHRKECPQ